MTSEVIDFDQRTGSIGCRCYEHFEFGKFAEQTAVFGCNKRLF